MLVSNVLDAAILWLTVFKYGCVSLPGIVTTPVTLPTAWVVSSNVPGTEAAPFAASRFLILSSSDYLNGMNVDESRISSHFHYCLQSKQFLFCWLKHAASVLSPESLNFLKLKWDQCII
jgi:hypothetical protein